MRRIVFAVLTTVAAATAQTTPAKPAPQPARKSAAGPANSFRDLRYPDLRPITLPPVDTFTLPNGLQVYLLEDHELPLLVGTVLVRTGSALDPPEKHGVAALTGQNLLEGGTSTKPGVDMMLQFQNLGAEVQGSVSENTLAYSFSVLKENSGDFMELIKEALVAPEFRQERLDYYKTRLRNAVTHRFDDPATIAQHEFVRTVYGKSTPYAAQVEHANIDLINRADLVNFHRRYFFPKNVMLALEGDFDTTTMKSRLTGLFADWHTEQAAAPEFPKVTAIAAPGRFLAVRRDVSVAYIAVGQLSGDYLDKDYPALQVAANLLGNDPLGRLTQRLRDVVDPLKVSWSPGPGHPGLFEISGTINPFVTAKVLQAIDEELEKLRTKEVSDDELRGAKDAALNSYVFSFENRLSLLPRLTLYEYLHLPQDYVQKQQQALAAVTRADVLRVAKERLDPTKMTTVVVGNPTAFESPLESVFGSAVQLIDLSIAPPTVEAAPADEESQQRGKDLITRAQQAIGGVDKLADLKDYAQDMTYQFDPSAGGLKVEVVERWAAPGYLRQDNTLPSGKVSAYCDGKTGWVSSNQGAVVLTGLPLQQMQSDLFRTFFPLLLSDRVPGRKLSALDDRTLQISDTNGNLVKLVLDPATGLVQQMLYDAPTANGPQPVMDAFSDYRDVNGIKVPFKVTISLAGQKYQDVTVKSTQINVGLKVQDLEKRP